jgi:hypothetical protein
MDADQRKLLDQFNRDDRVEKKMRIAPWVKQLKDILKQQNDNVAQALTQCGTLLSSTRHGHYDEAREAVKSLEDFVSAENLNLKVIIETIQHLDREVAGTG